MSDNEFFRALYRKTSDLDGYECVVPTVWMGNQGFELNVQYGEEEMTAQQHAEWFVSMFKKAIDNYADQHLKDVLEKDTIMEAAHDHCFENYSSLEHPKEVAFLDGVEWLLNHLKQQIKSEH